MKTYLVTGCAGFIGSNFVHYMLEKYEDIRLVNLDKLTYAGNLENLQDIEDDARHIFVQGDICDKALVTDLIAKYDPDYVINFAAESHVDRSIKNPEIFVESNVLGTVNPVRRMIEIAHSYSVPVLVDGAQSTPHFAVDMQSLDADFFAFSGHKIYGPTGVGVLYGKETWLDRLPPYMGGGEMIRHVTFEHTTFNGLPFKFEAGTPDYVATTGLARALDYVAALGMDNIHAHEQELTRYALERMRRIPGMRILGEAGERDAVISFLVGGIHHLDMGTLLDRLGIAVRTGHHCAEPLMRRLGVEGTVRASFALYNTRSEVDALVEGIERGAKMF